jgi:hypothetical protein
MLSVLFLPPWLLADHSGALSEQVFFSLKLPALDFADRFSC